MSRPKTWDEIYHALEDPYNAIKFMFGFPSYDDNGNIHFNEDDMRLLGKYIETLREQRDNLLVACESLLEEHGWYHPELPEDGQGSCAACCSARAAIATARPTEPVEEG